VVQVLKDLDTACSLALLQEENNNSQSKENIRYENSAFSKPYFKGALPLPRSPLRVKGDNILEEKKKPQPHKGQSVEEKIATVWPGDCAGSMERSGLEAINVLHQYS
jgi:hypothetical protein